MMAAERKPEQADNPLADALLCGAHRRTVLHDQSRNVSLANPLRCMPHQEMADEVVNLKINRDGRIRVTQSLPAH